MSLVIGFCNGKHALIASDGRAGGNICPSEEYDKTRKINNNIILGFVGYKESGEYFLNGVYSELGEKIKDCYIDKFLEVVDYGMNLKPVKGILQASFLIIGKTEQGGMQFVTCGQNTDYKLTFLDANIGRLFPIGGTIPKSDILDICEYHSKSFNGNIKTTLKNIIIDVSKIDDSINQTIYYQEISYYPILHIL